MDDGDSNELLIEEIKDAFGSWRFHWSYWLDLRFQDDDYFDDVDCREWPRSRWSLTCDWIESNLLEPTSGLDYYAEVWRALLPPMMVCQLRGASFDEHIWYLTLGLSDAGRPVLRTRGWRRPDEQSEGLYFAALRMRWMTREQLDVARKYLAVLDDSVLGPGGLRRVRSVLEGWDTLIAAVERRRAMRR